MNRLQILTTITSNIFQYEDTPTNEKLLRLIEEGFAHPERYEETIPAALYILIHNIDGPALRNLKAQTILSQLAAIPQIHFVASVDHINACQCKHLPFALFRFLAACSVGCKHEDQAELGMA